MDIRFIDLESQYHALKESIDRRINAVLDHGQYIMGPEVAELEAQLSSYVGTSSCITVASGTEALLIALMAIGVNQGDEIVTTPFTFVSTAEVIALLGATPVFVDVEPDTGNIDSEAIEAAITPKTKAIIPVSLYGQPANMNEINAIADRFGITVIEDAAQSFGAEYKGRKSCNLSKVGCTSFFPSKPLGCYGDGGAIFTSDPELAQVMREIRVHGQSRRYVHTRIGVGGRMDTIQCAIVLAKLERFSWEITQRQKIAALYVQYLQGRLPLLSVRADRSSVFAQFTVLVRNRSAVQQFLADRKIPTAVHYPIPLHQQSAYQAISKVPFGVPVSESLSEQVMSLPMSADLSPETVYMIAEALIDALDIG